MPIFVTKFSDFVIALNERGYELDGIFSFSHICRKISFDESASGEICVSFEKENSTQK